MATRKTTDAASKPARKPKAPSKAKAPQTSASPPAPVEQDPLAIERPAFSDQFRILLENTRRLHEGAKVEPLNDDAVGRLLQAMLGAHNRFDATRGTTPHDGPVLELGPGEHGQNNRLCSVLGAARYVGVDPVPRGEWVVSGLAECLPQWQAVFQWVVAFRVLEHLFDPTGAICEVARVLANGGIFACAISTDPLDTSAPWTCVLDAAGWCRVMRAGNLVPVYVVDVPEYRQIHLIAVHADTARLVGIEQ